MDLAFSWADFSAALAPVVIYFYANRFAGGGLRWEAMSHNGGGPLRGRPIWYATPIVFLLTVPFWGWTFAAWAAASFLLWRSPGWYQSHDMGIRDHSVWRDFAVMTARGALLFPAFWVRDAWPVLAVVSVAIALSYLFALRTKVGLQLNQRFASAGEYLAGAAIGAAFAAIA